MKLIDTNDFLLGSHGLNRFRESLVSKLVMYILRLHKLDKLNVKVNDDDPEVLLDSLIEALGVTIEVSKEDLEKIPKNGTFITVYSVCIHVCVLWICSGFIVVIAYFF